MQALIALLGGYRAAGFALALLLALGLAGVQTVRLSHVQAHVAQAQAAKANAERGAALAAQYASEAARAEERSRAAAVDAVARAYERGKTDAKAAGDRVAAGLRAGNLQLREQWRGCEARSVPGAAPDPGLAAGAADWRAGSAGRIVGATARDGAQIRCLQAVALTDRGIDPGDLSRGCPATVESRGVIK